MKRIFPFILITAFYCTVAYGQEPLCSLAKTSLHKTSVASPADVVKMNGYNVYFYKIDVAVERNSTYISGNAEIHATATTDLTEFIFELHDTLSIDSILLDGSKRTYNRTNGIVSISTNMLTGNRFMAKIYYHGFTPQGSSAAIGNGFSNSSEKQATWTLSQPYAAYEWWPCKQVLYDKADSAEIWITTDSVNKAGSNGLLVHTTDFANGKRRYEWKTHYAIDYYLLSVAVARYKEYNLYAHPAGAIAPILVQNYFYDTIDSYYNHILPWINHTPAFIEKYSELYGMYPFALEKYGHCMTPLNGGMEHQTMTTLGFFSFNVVSHELAHQWFGDYVTCGSWADIWLNEGFASYSEFISNEQFATGNATSWMASAMNDAKNASGSVYVTDTQDVSRIFDGASTYHKGAVLLHMLRYEINDDSVFYLGLRNYLDSKKFSTALGTDFKTVMEQTSGKDLGYFFDQWYYGYGYPFFSARWNQIDSLLYINLTQLSTNISTLLFKTSMDITVLYDHGDSTIIRVWSDSLSKIYTLDVAGKTVTGLILDQKNRVLNDIGNVSKDPLFNAVPDIYGEGPVILIYPNPANDRLNIDNAKGCRIQLVDMTGRIAFTSVVNDKDKVLSLADLAPGVYMIYLEKEGRVTVSKFVKQ